MRCPFCRHSAHTRTSRYVVTMSKKVICSARIFTVRRHLNAWVNLCRDSFSGHGGKTSTASTAPAVVRKVKGCYSSPFTINQETGCDHNVITAGFWGLQNNKAAWLQRKNELAAAEQDICGFCPGKAETSAAWTNYAYYRSQKMAGESGRRSLYSFAEAVQHISIRERLNDFMQQHAQHWRPHWHRSWWATVSWRPCPKLCHTACHRCPAWSPSVLLAKGEKINYSAQDSDILTTTDSGLTRLRWMTTVKNSPLREHDFFA